MGIPLDIFSLYRLQREDAYCQHYLLLRVEQPEFNNADESDYARAVDVADQKKSSLIEAYVTEMLADACAGRHKVNLVGELQASPVGDALFEERGGFSVDLWIAETRFGHPWVVLGTAENEAAFWREVEQDEDLSRLGAIKPAAKQRAYFLTEKDHATRTGR
ncbi:MAG TPA: hypothetical protein VFZ66_14970 [Herpetosiphonaceae bacterium]